jgi:hypothetical protein
MRVLLKDLGEACKEVVRCDNEPPITRWGNAFYLRTKVPVAGQYDIISTTLKTLFQHSEHCSTFRSERAIVS